MKIKIGTRGSKLALVQAEYVKSKLMEAYPAHECEIVIFQTRGDRIQNKPLSDIGGKGVFVQEIEEALRKGEIQIGVHSMKDMPAEAADGLIFAKSWKREDARDVLVLRTKTSLEDLQEGAVIATGSPRRALQMKRLRPDIQIVGIRGNVDTRLRKMEELKLDGIVLAAAGLKRLGMEDKITCYLDTAQMIPAPAQGILALEIAKTNTGLLEMLNQMHEETSYLTGRTERLFLEEIGGDCHAPVGAFCTLTAEKKLQLRVMFGKKDSDWFCTAQAEENTPEETARTAANMIRRQMAGCVYLVGGGPGDAGLLTVRGRELLEKADCIIYDRLSSPQLLNLAKPDCEMIYVGKENHHHVMKQEEIQKLLAQKAMEYSVVVRLKGGDPYVFGRGGEEGIYLTERGISFEEVPGVSSAIAGLAYAGIPITHRGVSMGFHVITAHSRKDEMTDIDFSALTKSDETKVFLMGLSCLPQIMDGFLKAGMPEDTGAAVISCATMPNQRTVVSDLIHITEEVQTAGLISPALIVVGNVVKLRNQLNFYEEKKLYGRNILVPKIGSAPSRLAALLREQGAAAEEIQIGEIVTLACDFTKEELQTVDWMIFTSAHGIDGFFENLKAQGMDARALADCRIAVVGKQTAKHLQNFGITADFVPKEYNSTSLGKELAAEIENGAKIWYPCAVEHDGNLKEILGKTCEFVELAVYENKECESRMEYELREEFLQEASFDAICFTSASAAARVSGLFGKIPQGSIFSIGPKCSEKLKELGVSQVHQAEYASYQGVVEKVLEILK